jgi:glutamine synthetase
VNSYRRLLRNTSAPINVRWGYDNRTVGLRVPLSDPENRRVENRLPSSDANPYLAIAASLACGYLGLVNELEPDKPSTARRETPASRCRAPSSMRCGSWKTRRNWSPFSAKPSCGTYRAIKETEHETFMGVISAWEREYLLLSV